VVSWIRRRGSRLERPGKQSVVNWERLVEDPVREVFNSHLRINFSNIPREVANLDIARWWKEFNMSPLEGAVPVDLGVAEAAKVVKKLLGGKTPGGRNRALGLGWWFPFSKRGTGESARTIVGSHYSASRGKFMPGCWKGGSDRWLNLGFKTSSADSVPGVELWTSSSPSQGSSRGPGSPTSLHVLCGLGEGFLPGPSGVFVGGAAGQWGFGLVVMGYPVSVRLQ